MSGVTIVAEPNLIGIDVPGCSIPTRKSLLQHARYYGKEGVMEVARWYNIPLAQEALDAIPNLRPNKPKKGFGF